MSMTSLLKKYIRSLLEAVEVESVRDEDEGNEDALEEFSAAGGCAGFTAPLGASASDLGGDSTNRKKHRSKS